MRLQLTVLLLSIPFIQSISQKINTNDIIGNYKYHFAFFNSEFEFKPDNSFTYHWQNEVDSGTTIGKWKLDKGYIILNSDKQPNKDNSNLAAIEKTDNQSSKTIIKIKDENSNPVYYASCTIYANGEKLSQLSDTSGICVFNKLVINKIQIDFVGYKSILFEPKKKSNYFEFNLSYKDKPYVFFTNEKWIIKNKQLYEASTKKKKPNFKKYYKKNK